VDQHRRPEYPPQIAVDFIKLLVGFIASHTSQYFGGWKAPAGKYNGYSQYKINDPQNKNNLGSC
jgi:hypothetical protein